jgi:hypothetical protein
VVASQVGKRALSPFLFVSVLLISVANEQFCPKGGGYGRRETGGRGG